MTKELHFKVHCNLYNEIVRQAYWFEGRKKRALDVLRCLNGITIQQEKDFLLGNAYFINSDDRESVELVYEEDKDFKKELNDWLFGDGKLKFRKENGMNKISGWLTKDGFFIPCSEGEHIYLSEVIVKKLNLLKKDGFNNFERLIELNGAIKISDGRILYPDGVYITKKQEKALKDYIESKQYNKAPLYSGLRFEGEIKSINELKWRFEMG